MRYYLLFFVVVLLSGCKVKPLPPKVIKRETTIVERDTVFQVLPDSSRTAFKVNCINGKPVINLLGTTPGNYLDFPKIQPIGDNVYEALCEAKAQELFLKWKETHTQERIEIPVETNVLTFWQTLQIYLGRAFLLLLIVTLTPKIRNLL